MISRSFLLNTQDWDLRLDEKGNIAVSDNPYSIAQDVACACSTVQGECYYDDTLGIPYYDKVFARQVGLQYLQSKLQAEALKLPYVRLASCTLTNDRIQRQTTGVIAVVDENNESSVINL